GPDAVGAFAADGEGGGGGDDEGAGGEGGNKYATYLGDVPLHPSLVAAARSAGRTLETLLDCVPVERERAWAGRCRAARERLTSSFGELDAAYAAALGTAASRDEEATKDWEAEAVAEALKREVEEVGAKIGARQAERLSELRRCYVEAAGIASAAAQRSEGAVDVGSEEAEARSAASNKQQRERNSAVSKLEALAEESSSTVFQMTKDDVVLSGLSQRIADLKTVATRRMCARLAEISASQSAIGRANASARVLRQALVRLDADVSHLEHVVELPSSYRDFLAEVRRRRAHSATVRSIASDAQGRLGNSRAKEAGRREQFLRGAGRHLMPAFFDVLVPSLASAPPSLDLRIPDVPEADGLPDLGGGAPGDEGRGGRDDGLETTEAEIQTERQIPPSDKISHSSFEVGDVGLFMPTGLRSGTGSGGGGGGKRAYLAFHTGCPHRYLHPDCVRGNPDFVLGRILMAEEHVAGAPHTEANPYGLVTGTRFWLLTVEAL
ncbi:hypothetical protein ACHAWF_018890, partial [Thalassiosira exigua]